MSHTSGKLEVVTDCPGECCWHIQQVGNTDEFNRLTSVEMGEEDARRLVACWNAFEGMSQDDVEANLQAIHHIIEARRVELRHGTLALVRATFQGFLSLPAPAKREWWEVLEVDQGAMLDEARKAYQKLASVHHPDKGGNHSKMAEISLAWERAQKERS